MTLKGFANGVKEFLIEIARFTWKATIYMLFFCYLLMGGFFTYKWLEGGFYKMIPINILYAKVAEARQQGDVDKAIRIVRIRPPEETPLVLAVLEPHAPEFEPTFYIEFAKRHLMLGEEDEAAFWSYLAKFRLQYDMYRCKYAHVDVGRVMLSLSFPTELKLLVNKIEREGRVFEYLGRALLWDEKHPPQSRPEYLCEHLSNLYPGNVRTTSEAEPESKWAFHRYALRTAAGRPVWCNLGHDRFKPGDELGLTFDDIDHACGEAEGWKDYYEEGEHGGLRRKASQPLRDWELPEPEDPEQDAANDEGDPTGEAVAPEDGDGGEAVPEDASEEPAEDATSEDGETEDSEAAPEDGAE